MNAQDKTNVYQFSQASDDNLGSIFPRQSIVDLEENNIEQLVLLDSMGFLIGKTENIHAYKSRLLAMIDEKNILDISISTEKSVRLDKTTILRESMRLPPSSLEKSNKKLLEHYAFTVNWAPAFYSKFLGLFTGGYSISLESGLSCVLLTKTFRGKDKWLFYTKEELVTHELCHAARNPIEDPVYEEFFAYKFSPSHFRRIVGPCFKENWTALFLLVPILLVFCIQVMNIFLMQNYLILTWFVTIIYPLFLTIRAIKERKIYNKAYNHLADFGVSKNLILPILFRCTFLEILEISKLKQNKLADFINNRIEKYLRWKIIAHRFLPQK